MATTKVTFTLDQATVTRIQEAAECLSIPKSEVVREAVQEFFDKIERLTDRKRLKMLRAFDKVIPLIPNRDIRKRSRSCCAPCVRCCTVHFPWASPNCPLRIAQERDPV